MPAYYLLRRAMSCLSRGDAIWGPLNIRGAFDVHSLMGGIERKPGLERSDPRLPLVDPVPERIEGGQESILSFRRDGRFRDRRLVIQIQG
jgi:hypothetical protein